MWAVYLAVLAIASFIVFPNIHVATWSIFGAVVLVLVTAFVYAALKPKGPYESPTSRKPPGGLRGFFRSLNYYSDYLAPFAIGIGAIVYYINPDVALSWVPLLTLLAILFIVSAAFSVLKPVGLNDPQPSQTPSEQSPGFLRSFGRYLLYVGIWCGLVLVFDPDVTLTSGILMATGALVLILSLAFAVLKPQGPFQNSGKDSA